MSEFDSYAHEYETALECGISISGENAMFFARRRIARLAKCLQQLRFVPETVLDFGCGTGRATTLFFETLGAQSVIGVDLSAKSLEVARQSHENMTVDFKLTDEHTPNGRIHLAYCNGVFHHLPPAERQSVVKYIADSLRPGGVFALWENNPWSPGARYVMSRIPFDRDAIMVWPNEARSLVESAGLHTIRTDYCFIFPRAMKALRRVEPYLARLPFGAQYQVLAQKPSL